MSLNIFPCFLTLNVCPLNSLLICLLRYVPTSFSFYCPFLFRYHHTNHQKKNYFKTLSKQKSSMYISIVYFIDFHFSVLLLLVHVFPFTQIIIFLTFCLENFNGRYNRSTNPVKFFKLKKFVSKKKCNERL